MVAVRVLTATENEPSIPDGVPDIAVAAPDESVKPVGNVTMTLPSAGMGFTVVKFTVTLPVAADMVDAGTTLVEVSAPPVAIGLPATLDAPSKT